MMTSLMPYFLANLTPEQMAEMSYDVTEMFSWAAYEQREFDFVLVFEIGKL